MSDVRWIAYRDRFPFGIGAELGPLTAPDKQAAVRRATELYGAPVVVRALLAVEQATRERLGPGSLPPRAPRTPSPRGNPYRQFTTAKRQRALEARQNPTTDSRPPQTPQPLTLGLGDRRTDDRAATNDQRGAVAPRATGSE